jgi:hypothetical protein
MIAEIDELAWTVVERLSESHIWNERTFCPHVCQSLISV